jgi:hypothetical protein
LRKANLGAKLVLASWEKLALEKGEISEEKRGL